MPIRNFEEDSNAQCQTNASPIPSTNLLMGLRRSYKCRRQLGQYMRRANLFRHAQCIPMRCNIWLPQTQHWLQCFESRDASNASTAWAHALSSDMKLATALDKAVRDSVANTRRNCELNVNSLDLAFSMWQPAFLVSIKLGPFEKNLCVINVTVGVSWFRCAGGVTTKHVVDFICVLIMFTEDWFGNFRRVSERIKLERFNVYGLLCFSFAL